MSYIKRTLENDIVELSKEYSCLILAGPRQVGKSTMLRHLMEGTDRKEVSLDDLTERRMARTDPGLFLELHPAPLLIDEVQYAPELFSYIKIKIDNGAAPGGVLVDGLTRFQIYGIGAGVSRRSCGEVASIKRSFVFSIVFTDTTVICQTKCNTF